MVSNSLSDEDGGQTSSAPPPTYEECFNNAFPFYLSIGMTPHQYWEEDCTLTVAYRKAYEIQRERTDFEHWQQGMYIYEALCDTAPLFKDFAKHGTRAHPYPRQPYGFHASKKREVEDSEVKKYEKNIAKMDATMEALFNKRKLKMQQKEAKSDANDD